VYPKDNLATAYWRKEYLKTRELQHTVSEMP